jgi:peptidyl-prolyl cis-trans isomerase B (cyclophilin B)
MRAISALAVVLAAAVGPAAQTQKPAPPFANPFTLDQMKGKQAVVETTMGSFVIQLLPEVAPNHVGHFMKLAREGAYVKTTFHRLVKYGLVQAGDPLSKDPAKAAQYGTGGLNVLKGEINKEPMTAGAVATVLIPNRPDSGGAQFFVCVIDQPPLQGQYTIFGRVVEGIETVQQISAVETDTEGKAKTRVEITNVTIRDTPAPVRDVIATGTPAELASYRVTLETTKGPITLEFLPEKAPETVRQFLLLARAGVYDGVGIHRVAPNFVIQTGALAYRAPLTPSQQKLVRNLAPEFNDTPTVAGVVSMARGDDPGSANTSFFICIGACSSLDGKYTAFARVAGGMDAVKAIAAVPVDGETPKEAITVSKAVVTTVGK